MKARSRSSRRLAAVLLLILAMTGLVAGCGSSSSSSSAGGQAAPAQSASSQSGTTAKGTHFAKTKFALHAGLAFGAFHRYIYKPYKEGKFSGGLLHHKLRTVKAALAAAFAYHEVRLALDDARSSKILSTLLSPLLAMQTKLSTLRDQLHGGNVNPSEITSANGTAGMISAESAGRGQPIKEQSPTL